MSETSSHIRLIVGGHGRIRFAVDLSQIEGVEGHADVVFPHKCVNLPLLFDLPTTSAPEDRYARVPAGSQASYLRLGPELDLQSHPSDYFAPMPAALSTTAARWAWAGLAFEDEHAVVLVDAPRLAALGAPCENAHGDAR